MLTQSLSAVDLLTRSAEEVLGGGELRLLPGDRPAREGFARLQADLEQVYGPRAGAGLALRIGRALFHHGLRVHGRAMRLDEATFRLLPFAAKLRAAGTACAQFLEQRAGIHLQFEQTADRLTCTLQECPLCAGASARPGCHLAIGLLQEALYWLSGGKHYPVEETACRRNGAPACVLTVDLARGA